MFCLQRFAMFVLFSGQNQRRRTDRFRRRRRPHRRRHPQDLPQGTPGAGHDLRALRRCSKFRGEFRLQCMTADSAFLQSLKTSLFASTCWASGQVACKNVNLFNEYHST